MKDKSPKNKKNSSSSILTSKSQIWIETVIYTLIALSIIGLLLAFLKPAIDEKKDKLIIEQSQTMLSEIEKQIDDVRFYGTGNSRTLNIAIKKGELTVDGDSDQVFFMMRSKYQLSESGENITIGNLNITTIQKGREYEITLLLNYANKGINITFEGEDKIQTLPPTTSPYKISVSNQGRVNELQEISFVRF